MEEGRGKRMAREYPSKKYLANRGGEAYRCGVSL